MRGAPFLLSLLLVCQAVTAEVYRWVDDEGRVHFSDRPAPEATAVPLAPGGAPATDASEPQPDGQGAPILGPYTAFEIVSPEANATLRLESESLPFALLIDPPLQPSHRLSMVVDGAPVAVETPVGTQLSLTGVGLGSHVAEAVIHDADGGLVAQTPRVNFHLRRPVPPGVLE
jgi:hypothetical protein